MRPDVKAQPMWWPWPLSISPPCPAEDAWQEVGASFERFCLTTGFATLAGMLEEDATRVSAFI